MYQNVLAMGPAYAMYSTTFGNPNFIIQPASPGEVADGFPAVPYFSLEAALYSQMASNPMIPTQNLMTGSTSGTQNLSGQLTLTNSQGVVQGSIGNISNSSSPVAPVTNSTT